MAQNNEANPHVPIDDDQRAQFIAAAREILPALTTQPIMVNKNLDEPSDQEIVDGDFKCGVEYGSSVMYMIGSKIISLDETKDDIIGRHTVWLESKEREKTEDGSTITFTKAYIVDLERGSHYMETTHVRPVAEKRAPSDQYTIDDGTYLAYSLQKRLGLTVFTGERFAEAMDLLRQYDPGKTL